MADHWKFFVRSLLGVVLFIPCSWSPLELLAAPNSPISAQEALRHVRLAPGLKMELAAAEPLVVDPVAVRFDAAGRMWVVEMRDYPLGPAQGAPPASRIRVLEDRDGDGRFEIARTFADKLPFITGLQPWRGGVFVTLAGRVAYMKDANGDGRADVDETWYTGFAQQNSQLRANHPRLGLDNHVYVANGLRGGTVADARNPKAKPVSISGMDFRFDPLTGKFEAVSGVGQFGLTFDDFGNRFVCSNRNPLKHIVLEDRYLRRNPGVAVPAVFHDAAQAGAESRIFPISRAWTTSNLHAGQFTAACGVLIYRGDALGKSFYGNAFTCDPTGNLVHREIVSPQGATFTARPAREGVEFLASTDEWFRPVNVETGPDGALYVVDMYRAVIEHPQFMPEELKTRPDLRKGDDRGRIYRIVAKDSSTKAKRGKTVNPLDRLSTAELVKLFEHPNAWQRETAARSLLERQDGSVMAELERMAKSGKRETARIHALWALHGLRRLSDNVLLAGLNDGRPRVRQQAFRLAEDRLDRRGPLLAAVAARVTSVADEQERLQAVLSLSKLKLHDVFFADARAVALAAAGDPWTRRAVAIAAKEGAPKLLAELLQVSWQARGPSENELALMVELAELFRGDQQITDHALFTALASLEKSAAGRRLQLAVTPALAKAAARNRGSLLTRVDQLKDRALSAGIHGVFDRAAVIAGDAKQSEQKRIDAVSLLAYAQTPPTTLTQLALGRGPHPPSQSLRRAAISALSRQSGLKTWQALLTGFPSESPAMRGAILDAALARTERTRLLLDQIGQRRIKPGELDRGRVNRLLRHRDAALAGRAKKLLAAAIPADRQKVLAAYQTVLSLKSEPRRGLAVFKKACANCHRIGETGVNVAPDISDSRTKQPGQLLADILQPNRAIDANYVSYTIITADGRSLTGVIAGENATSVTLKQPEGKSLTLLRSDIDQMQSNGISLMPEGLEKNVSPQDMADLISFIKNWRYLDGKTPLGEKKGD